MTTNREKLRAGDVVQLIAPAYGEPDGLCKVIADQAGSTGLVWFTAGEQPSPYYRQGYPRAEIGACWHLQR